MHTVMVVDDQKDVGDLVGILLRYAGHAAICVDDGRKALEIIRQTPPNLVLLDMMMPNMSGMDVLAALRKDPMYKDMPVVMLTAVSDPAMQEQAKRLGADDYLIKGTDWEEMLVRIERHLQTN